MRQVIKNKKISIILRFLSGGILIAAMFTILNHSAPALKFLWRIRPIPLISTAGTGCQPIKLDPKVDSNKYNFVGSLEFVRVKSADETLLVSKDQKTRMFSLGKFSLPIETYTMLRIPKLWLYFTSDTLSDRDDKLYGLEDSYLSKIILKVGKKAKEVVLGKSGEHMFIELSVCPLGTIQPVNKETVLDFEIFFEIGCNNFQDGACLDNEGKPLGYINGADLTALIRLFANSWQDFIKDITIPLHFKYE